ncbi:MAG: hypothetical protein Q8P92_03750 [Candidatus Daviesbacteria bacterium]|nr:hypothetical protein [Candidatus Daviesbacteria bacterium]
MVEEKLCPDTFGEYLAGLVEQKRRDPLAPLDIPVFDSATNQELYADSPFADLERAFGVNRNHPTTRVDIGELLIKVYPTRFKGVAFVERVVRERIDQTCLEIL